MNKEYWDKIASDYEGEIFSVLANDRKRIISSKISAFGSPHLSACDFGCGIGAFLPILSRNFSQVYAIDISGPLLKQARDRCKKLKNITYLRRDLSKPSVKLEKVDFALNVNVAILSAQKKRQMIFKTICKHLRRKGHLLLIVPSLESALYADFRLVQWGLKDGLTLADATSYLDGIDKTSLPLRQGIVKIDGVATKHYLKEELIAIFRDMPLDVLSIEKVEYSWNTEFHKPPRWLKGPYPWDWVVVLRKKGN